MSAPLQKIKLYLPLIKSLQTGLLLATGIAGYLSAHTVVNIPELIAMSLSLFLAISGSTIMNAGRYSGWEWSSRLPASAGRS
jgi:heme O synthase-like polyprenyltransferase